MLEYPDKDAPRDLMRPDRGLDDSGSPLAAQFFGGGLSVESAAPAGGVQSGDILGLLWSRKWMILAITILLCAAVIPPLWLLIVPNYRATAKMHISPVIERVVFATEDNKGVVPRFANFVSTQVSTIRTPEVLRKVLERSEVQQTTWYRGDVEDATAIAKNVMLEKLMRALEVKPERGTDLIGISFECRSAKDATLIADTVAEEYKKHCDTLAREEEQRTTKTLRDELVILEQKINGLLQTKYTIAQQIGAVGSDDVLGDMGRQLRELEEELRRIQMEQSIARWELDSLGGEDSGSEAGSYALDPEWRVLKNDADLRRQELEIASQSFGRSHPKFKAIRTAVEHAEQMLKQREEQLDGQVPGAAPSGASTAFAGAGSPGAMPMPLDRDKIKHIIDRQEIQRHLLEEAIAAQEDRVKDTGEVAHDLAGIDEEIARTRLAEEQMHARLQALEIESKAPARISIASLALEPTKPYRDRRIIFSLLAVVGALGASCGLAYLRGVTDTKIRAIGDVRNAVSVPFLGQLPELPRTLDPVTEGGAMLGESIRMVRTSLLKRIQGRGRQVILVTSSTSQVGKTSVSILLSKSLAQLGKRVLLVEGDLRAPTVSQRLVGFESKLGLAALLCGQAKDEQVILPTDTPRFDVVAAGHRPAGFDFEKLANGVFSKCLARWKKDYDLIIVDSPPVLPVADSRILAGQVDGTVMVLRSSHCARPDVIQAYADLSAAGGTLLGTILIGGQSASRYGYGYGYGYGDGREVPQLENLADVDNGERRLLES